METIILTLIIGIVAGVVSGFVGIGGGLIIVPAMVFFFGMTQHGAQGTSLAMMLPPIGILAVYNYHKAGHVDLKIAAILAVTFIIGSYFGSRYAVNLSADTLKKIFGVFIIMVGIKLIFGK
ncbi:MAG: sulfite exporter TauE/SafE family protein [Bacteroidia bacterium]|nr:sulfite exporter TauE/SafE family protein [Bacteroidia bacterium]NNC86067.1 sulfite exporter TauE/SafE family protein [Bacteroidia bacterium]NNM15215.1 sulfite exporter TauE/SafE family protein [Bacteroidia bacterium]